MRKRSLIGTKVYSIRTPIVKPGDPLVEFVVDSIMKAMDQNQLSLKKGDIIGITESLIARGQNNFVTTDEITKEIQQRFDPAPLGILFPILSRNRFSNILRAITRATPKVFVQFCYPDDEVGNPLIDGQVLAQNKINPYTDIISQSEYRKLSQSMLHPYTGIDYFDYYRSIIEEEGIAYEFFLSNNSSHMLNYTQNIIVCTIHSFNQTIRSLWGQGANAIGLKDICNSPTKTGGYNEKFGLLGSNKIGEDKLKLFPRETDEKGQRYVIAIQEEIRRLTNQHVEVMIYGDGAYKDPDTKIWELADPVVCVDSTEGLQGMPNEIKIKYIADTQLFSCDRNETEQRIKKMIKEKESGIGKMSSQGTTPRIISNLVGSLCDLVSGSGDKGTPIIVISGYFDTYAEDFDD